MTKNEKRFISLLTAIMLWLNVQAQNNGLDTKMNDALRGGNKYYAVVAVLVTIFTVLFGYLIYQDVKLNKIKKDINSKYSNHNEQNRDA